MPKRSGCIAVAKLNRPASKPNIEAFGIAVRMKTPMVTILSAMRFVDRTITFGRFAISGSIPTNLCTKARTPAIIAS